MTTVEKDQYNTISSQYGSIEDLPQMKLCYDYVGAALGDCTGQTLLDLGGGTGFHARQSVNHGTKYVDVVDISEGMMANGKAIESQMGRTDVLRWHLGDITKPLDHLPLDKQYDIVLVGWTFDHAETDEDLEAMWKNASSYCKPGGRLISVQMESCTSPASRLTRFGVIFSDEEKIPGGIKYVYHAQTNPVMSCPATTMVSEVICHSRGDQFPLIFVVYRMRVWTSRGQRSWQRNMALSTTKECQLRKWKSLKLIPISGSCSWRVLHIAV